MKSLADKVKADNKRKQREYKPQKVYWYKRELQKYWIELISRYEYDLFVTLTFKEDIKRATAENRFESWIAALNNILFGRRYKQRGRGIRYAVSYESQNRGTLHMHALLGAEGLKELDSEYMAELWKCNGQQKNGTLLNRIVNGHAVIDIYNPKRGAIQYMTKDIYKDGEPDIFVPSRELEGKACSIETPD